MRDRLPELEEHVATRVLAISNPGELGEEYLAGLRETLTTALEYAISALERGEARAPEVPPSLLAQARFAAANGVGLETVLRRYLVGYALLIDLAVHEANGVDPVGSLLPQVLSGQAALFDQLIEGISKEHRQEADRHLRSAEQRRVERIRRLLAGEALDASTFEYDFQGHHLGLVVLGTNAQSFVRKVARQTDRRLLSVRLDNDQVWAWLGGLQGSAAKDLECIHRMATSERQLLAVGEPASGLDGWRRTHRQARAAYPFARRRGTTARYSEVALLASMSSDDLLCSSLRELYLAPLDAERDRGRTARRTLRAYFEVERNVSSTAATLGVKRHTVTNRLRRIDQILPRPLSACSAEVEAALKLEELNSV